LSVSLLRSVCEGLLFGTDEPLAVQTAVRYELEKHNNSTSTVFRLDRYEKTVDAADSFDVCKACESSFAFSILVNGWLGSRVVSVLDSGAEGPGFKSQSRRCRVTVLGKLFTSIVPLFTKQRNW